jgi:hypothetical protein
MAISWGIFLFWSPFYVVLRDGVIHFERRNAKMAKDQEVHRSFLRTANKAIDKGYPEVAIKAIEAAHDLASQEPAKKPSFRNRFVEPVGLNVIASFLWEQVIKKAAQWIMATFFTTYMVVIDQDTNHVELIQSLI